MPFTLLQPLRQDLLASLSLPFYLQACPPHPPRSDCLGNLTLDKEQMPHTVEFGFLICPRLRKMFVMVGLSVSALLRMHA